MNGGENVKGITEIVDYPIVNDLGDDEFYDVFEHPSKYQNESFNKLEFIGDAHVGRSVKDFIVRDFFDEELEYFNVLTKAYVSNQSLAVIALENNLDYCMDYEGNLTVKMLADTFEAFIGRIVIAIINNEFDYDLKDLDELISDLVYMIDEDSENIDYIFDYYLDLTETIAKDNNLGEVSFSYNKGTRPLENYFNTNLQVGNKFYQGISRTDKRSKIIAMMKFIQKQGCCLSFSE